MLNLERPQYTQIVSWDEKHCRVVFDGLKAHSAHARTAVRIKRDANGKVDLLNGEYRPVEQELNVKYEDESRYSFGGGVVMLESGEEEGRRCKMYMYIYTGKWVHTIAS